MKVTKFATGASAVLTVYKKCDVKGAYAANYSEGIVLDGWTSAPQVGQLVAFGTGGSRKVYTVIESELTAVGEQTVYLDRPLENLPWPTTTSRSPVRLVPSTGPSIATRLLSSAAPWRCRINRPA
jgi:hypothetical protein